MRMHSFPMAIAITVTKLTNRTPNKLDDVASSAIHIYQLWMICTMYLWQWWCWLIIGFTMLFSLFLGFYTSTGHWQFTTCTLLGLVWLIWFEMFDDMILLRHTETLPATTHILHLKSTLLGNNAAQTLSSIVALTISTYPEMRIRTARKYWSHSPQ